MPIYVYKNLTTGERFEIVQRITEPAVGEPEELRSAIVAEAADVLIVGDGALAHRHLFEDVSGVEIADEVLAFPSASALVSLAHARAMRGAAATITRRVRARSRSIESCCCACSSAVSAPCPSVLAFALALAFAPV